MKWVTRERPKIDRIACPWLIARFIDEAPEFLFVPSDRVLATASATDRLFARYFAPAGVPKDWIAKVRAEMKGGDDVWKSARQLVTENSGIVQQTF